MVAKKKIFCEKRRIIIFENAIIIMAHNGSLIQIILVLLILASKVLRTISEAYLCSLYIYMKWSRGRGRVAFRGIIRTGQGGCCIRDIDVPHSAGAKRVRGAEGVYPGRRRMRSRRKRERSISLAASFFRLSARMDRRHADSGRVVVCRRRRMMHRGSD